MRFQWKIVCWVLFTVGLAACSGHSPTAPDTPEPAAETDSTAFVYNQKGDSAMHEAQYPLAMEWYQRSMRYALEQEDSAQYYHTMIDLAVVYEKTGDHERAITTILPAIAAFEQHQDSAGLGRAYATAAIFYGGAKRGAEQEAALKKAVALTHSHGSLIEQCAALNQYAFSFSDRQDWASAVVWLDSALVLMKQSGAFDNLPGMYLNLGNAYRELHRWDSAQLYVNRALQTATERKQAHVKARAMERLSQIAETNGRPAEALSWFKGAKTIRDSILSSDKLKAIEELDIRYQSREKAREITYLKASEAKAIKLRNLSLVVALLACALMLSTALFFYFSWKQRKRVLEQNKIHLNDLSALLLEKNEQIRSLTEKLAIEDDKAITESAAAPEYSPFGNPILTTQDWLMFVAYFDKAYPGFVQKLRSSYPDISDSEERLFLLLKLNMTRNEMAYICGVTPDAIKKMRYRLRRRLQLQEEDELEAFVRHFSV